MIQAMAPPQSAVKSQKDNPVLGTKVDEHGTAIWKSTNQTTFTSQDKQKFPGLCIPNTAPQFAEDSLENQPIKEESRSPRNSRHDRRYDRRYDRNHGKRRYSSRSRSRSR